jgi:predicted ATPase
VQQPVLAVLVPGSRKLVLIEDPEAHRAILPP